MNKFLKIIKFTFFTIPKYTAEWVEQNEMRIIIISEFAFVFMIILMLMGILPSLSFK